MGKGALKSLNAAVLEDTYHLKTYNCDDYDDDDYLNMEGFDSQKWHYIV